MGQKESTGLVIEIKNGTTNSVSLKYDISNSHDCSFCEKKSQEVKRIFKGKYATICDQCVELCEEIIEEDDTAEVITETPVAPKKIITKKY